jgi:hypothetical protein
MRRRPWPDVRLDQLSRKPGLRGNASTTTNKIAQ